MAARSPGAVAATLARPRGRAAANAPAGAGSVNASIPTMTQRLNRAGLRAVWRAPAISCRNPGEPSASSCACPTRSQLLAHDREPTMRSSPVIVGAARGGLLKGRAAVNSLGFGPLQRLLSAVNRRHGDHSQDSRIRQQEALHASAGRLPFLGGSRRANRVGRDCWSGRRPGAWVRAGRRPLGRSQCRSPRDDTRLCSCSSLAQARPRGQVHVGLMLCANCADAESCGTRRAGRPDSNRKVLGELCGSSLFEPSLSRPQLRRCFQRRRLPVASRGPFGCPKAAHGCSH